MITDFTSGPYQNARQMMYAGGTLNLNNQSQYAWTDFNADDPADVAVLRRATRDIFYTVVNSNAMNYEITGYSMPVWSVIVIVADVVIVVGLAVWGFFAIRKALRRNKTADDAENKG